ncbi:MAG: hypothetical protein OEO23_09085, partial [Gemmatimonadota bacterium]|nr:hypothetical protein [Gemmatimonadota bacterium]
MSEERTTPKPKVLRLRALVVAAPFLLALVGVGYFVLDGVVKSAIEDTGADIVGAKVELRAADFQLGEGRVVLEGLQVANPDAPFTNLLEAGQIVVDLRVDPLLQKKVVADSFVIRNVRFGTQRETSGALENPDPESGRLWREVNGWADRLALPEFSLDGLRGMVDTDALSDDSLASVALARRLVSEADSVRAHWLDGIQGLDPRPVLDSARALTEVLGESGRRGLNLVQTAQLVRSAQRVATDLIGLQARVGSLDSAVVTDVARIRSAANAFGPALDSDLAYGRRLLRIPSLEAPNFSPVVFHETAISWLKPILYWVNTAERYLPPGLDPRRRPGPKRRRASGTTVAFPGGATYPAFLLEYGAVDLEIGGTGPAAARYDGTVRGLSSAPALAGRPFEVEVRRAEAAQGPDAMTLRAVLDHRRRPLQDSVRLRVAGAALPTVELFDWNRRLVLGRGDVAFALARRGDEITANLHWVSDQIRWEGGPVGDAQTEPMGSEAWVRSF